MDDGQSGAGDATPPNRDVGLDDALRSLLASPAARPPRPEASSRVFSNLQQNHIEITEDRARLVLLDFARTIRHRRDWVGPAGLMCGLGVGLFTGDFKGGLGFSPDAVKGMVTLACVLALVWTAWSAFCAYRAASAAESVDGALDQMRHRKSGE